MCTFGKIHNLHISTPDTSDIYYWTETTQYAALCLLTELAGQSAHATNRFAGVCLQTPSYHRRGRTYRSKKQLGFMGPSWHTTTAQGDCRERCEPLAPGTIASDAMGCARCCKTQSPTYSATTSLTQPLKIIDVELQQHLVDG